MTVSPGDGGASSIDPGTSAAREGSDMFGATFGGDTSGFGGLVRRPPVDASSPRPNGSWFDESVDALAEAYPGFGDAVTRVVVDRGELTLHVRPDRVAEVCQVLRDSADHRFELLSSVSGVDYPSVAERLHVDVSVASRQAAQLCTSGLVERLPDPEDRRSHRLRTTVEGRERLRTVRSTLAAQLAQRLDKWEQTDAEALVHLLDRLRICAAGGEQTVPTSGALVGSVAAQGARA